MKTITGVFIILHFTRTHIARDLFGLPDFKKGDDVLFGVTNNSSKPGKLDFRDLAL